MPIATTLYDAAAYLDSDEQIAAYLEAVFEDGDPAGIAMALGNVARARNMAAIARETGLTRETLYRAFAEGGNPTLATLAAVTKALGFKLSIKPA
jgi:probable addiction module antidote protein